MAKASDNVFPKVQFSEETAPATPSAGQAVVYVKADGKLYLKDDAGTETDLTATGAGSGDTVKGWVKYLRERLSSETANGDDDFFTSDTSADYTTTTVSGTATWTLDANHNLLSVKFDDQTASDAAAYLKALTSPTAPVTIETAVRVWGVEITTSEFAMVGLVLADGTTAAANSVALEFAYGGQNNYTQMTLREGTLTNVSGTSTQAIKSDAHFHQATIQSHMYMRLMWLSTTTVAAAFSMDGVTWTDFGVADHTISSFTPTHAGFYVTTWGGNDEAYAAFEYLRRYNSDLSL